MIDKPILDRQISAKEQVAVIREVAPRYDKHLHSKVQRPSLYGIRLTEVAEQAIVDAFGSPQKTPKKDYHRIKGRIQCRLTEAEIDRLQQALNADGFGTMQDCLAYLVRGYIERIEGNEKVYASGI